MPEPTTLLDIAADGCCSACGHAANEHVLAEYYPPPPPADPAAAFKSGVSKLLDGHGGFLCIPADPTTAGFVARNREGHREVPDPRDPRSTVFESVTVTDARRGVERTYLPPLGTDNSELTAVAGRIKERDLRLTLGWQGVFALESLCSRLTGGASSYFMLLGQATAAGGRRFHVPTLQGLFPGQRLKIDLLEDPLFTVLHLGQDAAGPYFDTREPAPRAIPAGAPVYNKNSVGVLTLSDTSNCDNQGTTLDLHRRAYGAGDTFLFAGILEYQSNVYSALGDEGAVGAAVNLQHDLGCFHGEVESWTPAAGREGELVYKTTAAHDAQKLGTSRPLVNLNDGKWKLDGVANVLGRQADPTGWLPGLPKPRYGEGCVLLRPKTPPADWQKYVGWFLALVGRPDGSDSIETTDASEYYRKGEPTPLGAAPEDVYRWWYVTEVQEVSAGLAFAFVDRVFQRDREVAKSGPLLFRADNYTTAKAEVDPRRLKYILAPGAFVADVRDGVAGNVLGNEGVQPTDARRIVLAPGDPQLAPGDPITNALGPDVFHPTGFRARQIHHFPASSAGASFLSENLGRVQVGCGLHIAGLLDRNAGEAAEHALARLQKDGKPQYGCGLWFTSTAESALRIEGYSRSAALELVQWDGDQRILWKNPETGQTSDLRADRPTGDFVLSTTHGDGTAILTGGGGLALTELRGLSATATAAHNLRGTQALKKDDTKASVTFVQADGATPNPEPDAHYRVFLQCTWPTASAVVRRTADGFDVEVSEKAPDGASFDWLLVR